MYEFYVQGFYDGKWEIISIEETRNDAMFTKNYFDGIEDNPHRVRKYKVS